MDLIYLKSLFEKELKTKIFQKTNSFSTESDTLLKYFKYYDINKNNLCSFNDFIKTLNIIGISGFDDNDLKSIFNSYSIDCEGNLNYLEFIGLLFKNKSIVRSSSQILKKSNNKFNNIKNSPYNVFIYKIRHILIKRGIKGIFLLYTFNFNNNEINYYDMISLNQKIKLGIDVIEIRELYNEIKSINFDKMMKNLRGNLDNIRKIIVEDVYYKISQKFNNRINLSSLLNIFNVKNHPYYINGKFKKDIIYNDFCNSFKILHQYYFRKKINQSQNFEYNNIFDMEQLLISIEEFMEYFENISLFVDNDDDFDKILIDCFTKNDIYYGKNYYFNNNQDNDNPNPYKNYNKNIYNQYNKKNNNDHNYNIINNKTNIGSTKIKRRRFSQDNQNFNYTLKK